jgi:preprotein translocase subunit SecY
MAENLAKGGTYVPGVRPGEDTEEYFAKVTTRVTFFGALFLAFVAILPIIVGQVTGNQNLFIGGTSILIVVSVGIDLIRKVNAQISVREYLRSV